MKFKCMVHAPIGHDTLSFDFNDVPSQAELYEHIRPLVRKHTLDEYDIVLLNRIVDIHTSVLDFNRLLSISGRLPIEVNYTIRSFDHLERDQNYNTYIIPRKVADRNHGKLKEILDRVALFEQSPIPELKHLSRSLPYIKTITLL